MILNYSFVRKYSIHTYKLLILLKLLLAKSDTAHWRDPYASALVSALDSGNFAKPTSYLGTSTQGWCTSNFQSNHEICKQ